MFTNNFNIQGLKKEQVIASREKFGKNAVDFKKENAFWEDLKVFFQDPMVILLLVAAVIYFLSGQTGDGVFMVLAIFLVSGISIYQNSRSQNALEKLKDLSQPKSKVIREGEIIQIKSDELVVGDFLLLEEGTSISADGIIVHSNDFSVNESILTGESFAIVKNKTTTDNLFIKAHPLQLV